MERKDVDDALINYLWFYLPKKEREILQKYFIPEPIESSTIKSLNVSIFFTKLIWLEQDRYKVEDVLENLNPLWEKYGIKFKENNLVEWESDITTFKLVLDINFYRFGIINIKPNAKIYLDLTDDFENFKTNREALNLGIIGNKELEEKVRNKPEDNWLSEILQWKKDF